MTITCHWPTCAQVTSKRFVDYSLLVMRACLQQALADDFQAYMDREMNKMAGFSEDLGRSMRQHWSWSDPVLSLLEEEPAAARLRQHLQGREEKLVALEQLLAEHDLPHVPHTPSQAPPRTVRAAGLAAPKLPRDRLNKGDCNAAFNMKRIGESKCRPLELCWWPNQGSLPATGKEYPELGYKRLRLKPSKPQQQQQQPAVAQ
ncbi:hypothetical protein QJQ45_006586 [Haematococcus lacustris]|nr:hypothetical protein QJQ45_006586 [Haematococcus lacustris]